MYTAWAIYSPVVSSYTLTIHNQHITVVLAASVVQLVWPFVCQPQHSVLASNM
jgi:hypothetical protein